MRYMLRRPTPYLCHIIKKWCHVTIGKEVANRVVAAELGQQRAKQLSGEGGEGEVGDGEEVDWIRVAEERAMMRIEGVSCCITSCMDTRVKLPL